ncbi:MAG: hypothetical protein ACRELE_09865, partial [Gemmatimonadales bacterium]
AIGTGLLLGMIAAVMVAKVLTSLVVGISVHDVMPFAVASLAMIVVSACAIIIPGARVLRLNPAEIMRDT